MGMAGAARPGELLKSDASSTPPRHVSSPPMPAKTRRRGLGWTRTSMPFPASRAPATVPRPKEAGAATAEPPEDGDIPAARHAKKPPSPSESQVSSASAFSPSGTCNRPERAPPVAIPRGAPRALFVSRLRESGPLFPTAIGGTVLAALLAGEALVGSGRLEAGLVALTLTLASVGSTLAIGVGLSPRQGGRLLSGAWVLGAPILLALSDGLASPRAALASVGPLLVLCFFGRRPAVAAGGLSLGAAAVLTGLTHLAPVGVAAPKTPSALFEAGLGLLLAAVVLLLSYLAADLRSQLLFRARAAAEAAAAWLYALPDTLLHVDAAGAIIDARWAEPLSPPRRWRGLPLGEIVPELRHLLNGPRGAPQSRRMQWTRGGRSFEVDVRVVSTLEESHLRRRSSVAGQSVRPPLLGYVVLIRSLGFRGSTAGGSGVGSSGAEPDPDPGPSESSILQAGRLAQMGVLATGVAHEINNPLAYVLGNLQYLEEGLAGHEPRGHLAEAARDAADGARRIRAIVDNMRTFARSDDSDHLELVELDEVARSAVQLVRFDRRRGIRLMEEYLPAPPVFANPPRLAQVIVNLLVNAVQAMPEDRPSGTVTLRTGTTPFGEAFAEVVDDGVGLSEEHRSRVFEPFFTTRPIGQGTGLGLSICYGLVRRLGGSVDVESEVGRGSTFRIRLPNGTKLLKA